MMRLGSLFEIVKDKIDIKEYIVQYNSRNYFPYAWKHKCLLSIINQLADRGTDLDVEDAYGNTPLIYAIQLGCSKGAIIRYIERGANVNKCNHGGITPLFSALMFDRDKDIIDKLLDFGADVNAKDAYDTTPLMCALSRNCLKEVSFRLLYSTSDINSQDKFGKTAFVYALRHCREKDIILRLIDLGASVTVTDTNRNNVIHLARGSTWECISSCFSSYGITVNDQNDCGETPLFVAVLENDFSKVETLLSLHCDPNITNKDKKTPLHIARLKHIVNLLVYYGANLIVTDNFNNTPLASYMQQNCIDSGKEIVKHFLLLSYEKEVNIFSAYSDDLHAFVGACKKELNEMKIHNIANNLSFYNFCMLKKTKFSKLVNISKSEYVYKYNLLIDMFPLFFDIIVMKMRDNEVLKQKHDLVKKFVNISIKSQSYFEEMPDVEVNFDCIENIAKHLNHKELYYLFLASL